MLNIIKTLNGMQARKISSLKLNIFWASSHGEVDNIHNSKIIKSKNQEENMKLQTQG
jgi:hypothetical protein